MGKLILAQLLPGYFSEVLTDAQASGRPLYEVERAAKGVTHAELGAYLLGLWGMPYPVIEAVAHHHRPERCGADRLDVAAAVLLANVAAHEGEGGPTEGGHRLEELVASLGVDRDAATIRRFAAGLEGAQ